MRQRACRSCLFDESAQATVSASRIAQDLERDVAPEPGIVGAEHTTTAPVPEERTDLIRTDPRRLRRVLMVHMEDRDIIRVRRVPRQ